VCRVSGVGCRVYRLAGKKPMHFGGVFSRSILWACGLGFRVSGSGFRVQNLRFDLRCDGGAEGGGVAEAHEHAGLVVVLLMGGGDTTTRARAAKTQASTTVWARTLRGWGVEVGCVCVRVGVFRVRRGVAGGLAAIGR
jgi:hypothetical protein